MTTSHDRVELLEEVVDASTALLSFFAAERIEMKSTTDYLIGRVNDYEAKEGDKLNGGVDLDSISHHYLNIPVLPMPGSYTLTSMHQDLEAEKDQRANAEHTVVTLQKAVEDHVKQERLLEEKITWLEEELERDRQAQSENAVTFNDKHQNLLELIKKQTTEIDKLRKALSTSQSHTQDLKHQLSVTKQKAEAPLPDSSSGKVRELESILASVGESYNQVTTDLEQTRAALVTARREANEFAQKVDELTRQAATAPQGDFVESAERDDQLSDIEANLSREVEQLREKLRKIHVHLTRALRKFEDDPDMTIRAIDSALKLAGKA